MTSQTRHITEQINRPAREVYDFASDPANIPRWASGLGNAAENVDGQWFVDSPMGRISVTFAARNEFGILDHDVTLTSGEVFYNPMRVISDGDGCEVVFTLRRQPGVSDEEFTRDTGLITADLAKLKQLLEGPGQSDS